MLVKKRVKAIVVIYVQVCDRCGVSLGNKMIRVTHLKVRKGIRDRKEWNTISTKRYHPTCYKRMTHQIV